MESFKFQQHKLPHLLFKGTENSSSNFAVEVLRYKLYSRWLSIMDEAGRRVDFAPAPVMQSMVAIEGSVGYESWSHASFFPRKSADKHTKSYHLLGMTKLKILKHLKTRENPERFHWDSAQATTDLLQKYLRSVRLRHRNLAGVAGGLVLACVCWVAGYLWQVVSQQQAVLPCFSVHRPITVWTHSSRASFHWDEHIGIFCCIPLAPGFIDVTWCVD